MTVYADRRGGGWFWCPSCDRFGSLVELALAVWGCTIAEMLERFRQHDIHYYYVINRADAQRSYLQRTRARVRFLRLATESMKWLTDHRERTADLMAQLGLHVDMSRERWLAGPAKLFGGCPMEEIEICYHGNWKAAKMRKLFPGLAWGDVIVFPFFNYPRQVAAFYFVGRSGGPDDRLFSRIRDYRSPPGEAGLFGLPVALEAPSPYVIALADPIEVTRLQLARQHAGMPLLPLVAWREDATTTTRIAWDAFRGRKIILWAPTISAPLVRQATLSGGSITIGDRNDVAAKLLAHGSTAEVCDKLAEYAYPWEKVCSRWLMRARVEDIQAFASNMTEHDVSIHDLLDSCTRPARERALPHCRTAIPEKFITVRAGVTVSERDGRWYVHEDGKVKTLADFVVRFDRVEGRPLRWIGIVRHQGIDYPIDLGLDDLGVNNFPLVVLKRHGIWLDISNFHRFDLSIGVIAAAFHPPERTQPVKEWRPFTLGKNVSKKEKKAWK